MKKIINKKAKFNYEILDTIEAGLVLRGYEVKAIKEGKINLKGAFVTLRQTPTPELFLTNADIARYSKAGPQPNYDPTRPRKLLVHRKEIKKLLGKIQTKGLTLVPISVYNKKNRIKLEFGLAKGKKKHDKRDSIKKRDVDRKIRRSLTIKR